MAGHVTRMEKGMSTIKILTCKPVGKRPLGRPSLRWENNIRMDLKEISIRGVGLIRLRIGINGEPL
jgi:hypothetical protein